MSKACHGYGPRTRNQRRLTAVCFLCMKILTSATCEWKKHHRLRGTASISHLPDISSVVRSRHREWLIPDDHGQISDYGLPMACPNGFFHRSRPLLMQEPDPLWYKDFVRGGWWGMGQTTVQNDYTAFVRTLAWNHVWKYEVIFVS